MKNSRRTPDAVAYLSGGPDVPRLTGEMRFYQRKNCVLVEAEVRGLPRDTETGFFALHIHTGGSCEGEGFADTGGHYDPFGVPHPRHAGDLPPLMLCNGGAYLAVCTDRFRVRDIIGRTAVIHGERDDFTTQPAGGAGRKIACGVIRRGKMHT